MGHVTWSTRPVSQVSAPSTTPPHPHTTNDVAQLGAVGVWVVAASLLTFSPT